jgi:hypothetical protein
VIALLLSLALAFQGISAQAQQAGTISGVLKDAQGRPLSGIRMAAIARTQSLDDAIMNPSMSSLAITNEQGRYTLENIPPGRYFIAAGRLDVQTYYPGTSDLAIAKEVAITPGTLVVSGIDFSLGDSSFGRATEGQDGSRGPEAAIPLRVTVEDGAKLPVSTAGEFVTLKLDMGIGVIEWLITGTMVSVPGPGPSAHRVTVENLPEGYAVKSITYGTTDLLTNPLRLTPQNFSARPLSIHVEGTAADHVLIPQPALTSPSLLHVTLVPVPVSPKTLPGVRVSGQLSARGSRTVFVSGIPGTVYSDGTFEVDGVPPGRHSIVTLLTLAPRRAERPSGDNPAGLTSLAASVVVEGNNLGSIALDETALLPIRAWEPSPPKPAEGRAPGKVPLARLSGTLVEEVSKKPIADGKVLITNGFSRLSFPVDKDGRFQLPPLLSGTYDFEVDAFGHSNTRQSIEIDDKEIELTARRLF